MNPARRTAILVGGLAGGIATAGYVAQRAWSRGTQSLVAELLRAAEDALPRSYDLEGLAGLPPSVRRYFERALTPGQPLVRSARIEHAGEFRTAPGARWSPFRSVQYISADPPGFVWDARIRMAPLVSVRVRDHYLHGEAAMLAKAGSIVTVVDRAGGRDLAAGALHRYLGESAWLPTAMLPGAGRSWEALGESAGRITLRDGVNVVSLDVRFSPAGDIERVGADRFRDVDGVGILTPFEGRYRDHAEVAGMRIPLAGEVAWILPEGRFTYWRARIARVDYVFAGRS